MKVNIYALSSWIIISLIAVITLYYNQSQTYLNTMTGAMVLGWFGGVSFARIVK